MNQLSGVAGPFVPTPVLEAGLALAPMMLHEALQRGKTCHVFTAEGLEESHAHASSRRRARGWPAAAAPPEP